MSPGACKTDLFRDDVSVIVRAILNLVVNMVARTTEVGGRTLVDAVKPDLGVETHGKFLMDCTVWP